MAEIGTKEYRIIETIARRKEVSQRAIAGELGISLGLTNILINRLVKKGFLKAKKLNTKKISYIITPSGMNEKAHKSYHFMRRSFSVMMELKKNIEAKINSAYGSGKIEKVIINGSGELAEITELILKSLDLNGMALEKLDEKEIRPLLKNTVIFNTRSDYIYTKNDITVFDLWEESERLYGSTYELQ